MKISEAVHAAIMHKVTLQMSVYIWQQNRSEIFVLALRRARTGNCRFWLFSITDSFCSRAIIRMTDKKFKLRRAIMKKKTVKKVTTVIAASAVAASTMITPAIAAGQSAADDEDAGRAGCARV